MHKENAEYYKELGYAVSYYRKHKGLTQEQLAEKLGISRQHLGAIEAPNMTRAVSFDLLLNIARELDIDPVKLINFNKD